MTRQFMARMVPKLRSSHRGTDKKCHIPGHRLRPELSPRDYLVTWAGSRCEWGVRRAELLCGGFGIFLAKSITSGWPTTRRVSAEPSRLPLVIRQPAGLLNPSLLTTTHRPGLRGRRLVKATFALGVLRHGSQFVGDMALATVAGIGQVLYLSAVPKYDETATAMMQYYVYFSDAKVEMLAAQLQIDKPTRTETAKQVGIKSVLSIEHKSVREAPNKYKKLELVLDWIRSNADLGSIDVPGAYIEDEASIAWGIFHIGANHPMQDLGDKAPVVFWAETAATYFLMFGSPLHLIGRKKAPDGIGIWSASDAVHYLLAEVNNDFNLPAEDEFQHAVCRRIWGGSYEQRLRLVFSRVAMAVPSLPSKMHFVAKRLAAFDRTSQSGKSIVIASPIYVALIE